MITDRTPEQFEERESGTCHSASSSTRTHFKPAIPITDFNLKALIKRPPKRQTDFPDPSCPGLSARVTRNGRITWSLRIRVAGEGGRSQRGHRRKGQQYRLTLGRYPTVTIKAARAVAT